MNRLIYLRRMWVALLGISSLAGTARLAWGAQDVPPSFFGQHFFRPDIPWPAVSFTSLRLWGAGTYWTDINTAEGQYDWTHLDLFLDLARAHNVDLLYTFGATPRWASLRPNEPWEDHPLGGGGAAPPRDMRYWDDFVRAIATHNKKHGGRIKYWEIWNEWNAREYWTGDTATMVTMAQHAYRIIKSIDPNALVLAPDAASDAIANATEADNWVADYTNRFLSAGGGNYADVITFHGYRHRPEDINSMVNAIRVVMAANGQSAKPLWDTEGSWGQNFELPDLDEQAAYVARSYLLHGSKGVERFYWYGWDGYDESKPRNDWGTLWDPRRGGIQKSGIAYREVYQWLVGATMTSHCAVQSDGTTWICGLSRPGGYEAQAIWNTAGNVSIRAPSRFRQYRNVDGNSVAIRSGGSVTIGMKPILLETQASEAALQVSPLAPRLYPNPWRADKHAGTLITFDQLTGNVTVKLFTVSGHLVKTLSTSSPSTTWDLTNDAGDPVASGLYLYLLTNDQGQKVRGKLAVIR
ncbi:MAG: T9SS type A sorting domain-containing protein [Elusimicrobia bacterium]|nr:T9SS type A sorting domain-containing protein [Elusimicrobiota bacterium]